jgi:hypothetical protein
MIRVLVIFSALMVVVSTLAGPLQAMPLNQGQPQCAPNCYYVTRMVPCTRTEMVGHVVPCQTLVPVPRVTYRPQRLLLKGMPVGPACGQDPCTKCCPQPFCEMAVQQVPCVQYDYKPVTHYNVQYRQVCRPVMLPQTFMVQAYPLCP